MMNWIKTFLWRVVPVCPEIRIYKTTNIEVCGIVFFVEVKPGYVAVLRYYTDHSKVRIDTEEFPPQ